MIYDLCCEDFHRFEGWFSDRSDFENQLEQQMIACPLCESTVVVEKPVAPAVHVANRVKQLDSAKTKQSGVKGALTMRSSDRSTALRALTEAAHELIEKNFDNVGNEFATEAISMHLGDSETRNIRGTSTEDEIKDLEDLGVPFTKIKLPKFDD